MNIKIYINGVDRTNKIEFDTLKKSDELNNATDTLTFEILSHPSQTYVPVVDDEIVMTDLDIVGDNVVFGGVVVSIESTVEGVGSLRHAIDCRDYSIYLNRKLVLERYEDMDAEDIIAALVEKYAPDFTVAGVDAAVNIPTITFDRITLSEALVSLADQISYSWYVDYNKDVHFFAKNTELAPFNLTDTSNNYVYDSLDIMRDLSQLRNRVFIKGGEQETNPRTVYFDGTGVQDAYPLGYKFSTKPVVIVDGVTQDVGVEGIDVAGTLPVFWNYEQKYLRFNPTAIPSLGIGNIEVTGTPLLEVTVSLSDSTSIANYGVYEFKVDNAQITSRDEAIAYAQAQLEAYKDPLVTGSFDTYNIGLRSGQTINLNSTIRGINEDYLIQKVEFEMVTNSMGAWTVELATLKSVGIISFLQELLRKKELEVSTLSLLSSLTNLYDTVGVSDSVAAQAKTSAPYKWSGPSSLDPAPMYWNKFTWSA